MVFSELQHGALVWAPCTACCIADYLLFNCLKCLQSCITAAGAILLGGGAVAWYKYYYKTLPGTVNTCCGGGSGRARSLTFVSYVQSTLDRRQTKLAGSSTLVPQRTTRINTRTRVQPKVQNNMRKLHDVVVPLSSLCL